MEKKGKQYYRYMGWEVSEKFCTGLSPEERVDVTKVKAAAEEDITEELEVLQSEEITEENLTLHDSNNTQGNGSKH